MITEKEMIAAFNDNKMKFDDIPVKFSERQDLHAFRLLDMMMFGENKDIISGAEHDEIWLDVNGEELAEVASISRIHELAACGVMYDEDTGSLTMFA